MATAVEDNYNKFGLVTFLVVMALTFVFFIYISFIHKGVDFDKVTKRIGGGQMLAAGGAGDSGGKAAPKAVDVSGNTTPWKSSPDMIAHGMKAYKANCAVCHGNKGKGDGVAGMTLNPKPRDLVKGDWSAKVGGDTIGLFKTITEGMPGTAMAGFKAVPLIDRWAIVHWIQSVTKNKLESKPADLEKFGKTAK